MKMYELKSKRFLSGIPASPGIVTGRIKILTSLVDIDKHLQEEIILVKMSNPIYTTVFPKISGIITEIGGTMSHLAIVAREMGIPGVFGVSNACNFLKDGMIVFLDGKEGRVYY